MSKRTPNFQAIELQSKCPQISHLKLGTVLELLQPVAWSQIEMESIVSQVLAVSK